MAALARSVSRDQLWVKEFHIWMRGMTAQWMGVTGSHANSVAPLLISTEQGYLKSTFCKSLLPPALQRYYMDKVDLTSQGHIDRKDLLTDPTGSRRFICVLVEYPIDCEGIDYAQLYAQLKAEILTGEHYWFTKEEETELQQSNMTFYRQGPVEDVLRSCYRAAEKGEGCELLSSADIFQRLKKINPAAMRGANPASLAQILIAVGIERKHTKFGNVYRVVSV